MATVACPGCGLPRAEAEIGAKPCPVCDAAPLAPGTPRARQAAGEPDPTAGLPADVSELNAPAANRPSEGRPRVWLVGAVTFVLGALCGVGGVLAIQAIDWSKPKPEEPEVAEAPVTGGLHPPLARIAVAPMPHEGGIKPIVVTESDPDFQLPQQPPGPGEVYTVELNLPEATYTVPFPMKHGEHVVLRGKVKTLRVYILDGGAILDASGLEASVVVVTGMVHNRSTLKVNVPGGVVHYSGKVDGGSTIDINAPNGEVRFMVTTTDKREGSRIDNGSTVKINARTVEFKGDIAGEGTKVSVSLARNAWMKFISITGTATLEYKSLAAESQPDVIVGTVARSATFRRVD